MKPGFRSGWVAPKDKDSASQLLRYTIAFTVAAKKYLRFETVRHPTTCPAPSCMEQMLYRDLALCACSHCGHVCDMHTCPVSDI